MKIRKENSSNRLNFIKRIKDFFVKNVTIVPVVLMIMVLFTSLGYSSMSTSFLVSGDAHFRVKEDIRITDIKMYSATGGGYETYGSEYYKEGTNSSRKYLDDICFI